MRRLARKMPCVPASAAILAICLVVGLALEVALLVAMLVALVFAGVGLFKVTVTHRPSEPVKARLGWRTKH